MIDRYLLRYFLAVVDEGNFSRAAARVGVSQPTLSVGIARLEGLLDTRLFERSNQRVTLTDAGRRLLDHARRIEQGFNLAVAAVTGVAPRRPVRIGLLATLPTALIERIVIAHQRAGDSGLYELIDDSERGLVARLDRGRLDAAILIERPGMNRFAPEPLYEEDYRLMLAAGHPLAGADMIDPAMLAGETMIVRRHCEVLAETSRYFVSHAIRPHFAVRTTSDARAVAMVRAGIGVTVMPAGFAEEGVRAVPLTGFGLSRRIALFHSAHASDPADGHHGIIRAIRGVISVPRSS
jgi:LysR family hydrogen peroxide-inducible transcriptional activator